VDRAGVGVPLMTVNAKSDDGTILTPALTNDQGCALFRSIPVGGYTVGVNTTGYISKAGKQLLETTTTVNPNYVNNVSMTYDKKVNMTIAVRTLKPGEAFTATSVGYDSQTRSVSDAAADAAVLRTFVPTSGTYATSFAAPSVPDLFPYYNSPYSFFTGDCGYMSPTKASGGYSTYFSAINKNAAVQGDPTVYQPQAAKVFQPALNIRLMKDSKGTALAATTSTIKVFAKLTKPTGSTDTCDSEYLDYFPLELKDWPATTYGATLPSGANAKFNFVSQSVTGFDPGLPFGKYTLCFLDQTYSGSGNRKTATTTYDNTNPNGQTSTIELTPSSWTTVSNTATTC
jgi:hypothetical protein